MSVCDNALAVPIQIPPQHQPQQQHQQQQQQQQQSTQSIADYLAQLLKDRKQMAAFPNVFNHVERLLDEEIARVRASLFQINGVKKEPLCLPEPEGQNVALNEKVYVPVREHPDFNFVGRILGPRGMTAKQLEQETGCKIMVRGKGSMRDKKKEDANRGKPNWEHLSDDLHVLITVEDTENRAKLKLAQAVNEVQKLLVPQAEGEDELKKRQLMELAIINGTYRDTTAKSVAAACEEEWRRVVAASAENRLLTPTLSGLQQQIRAPTAAPLGAPLILSQRMTVPTTAASILSGQGAPGGFENTAHGFMIPYSDYANYAALTGNPLLTEYADHGGRKISPSITTLPVTAPPIILRYETISTEKRIQIIQTYYENLCSENVAYEKLCQSFGPDTPLNIHTVRKIVKEFEKTASVHIAPCLVQDYTVEQCVQIISNYYKSGRSAKRTYHQLEKHFQRRERPNQRKILQLINEFETHGSIRNIGDSSEDIDDAATKESKKLRNSVLELPHSFVVHTKEQRVQIIQIYYANKCSRKRTFMYFGKFYSKYTRPMGKTIDDLIKKFEKTASVLITPSRVTEYTVEKCVKTICGFYKAGRCEQIAFRKVSKYFDATNCPSPQKILELVEEFEEKGYIGCALENTVAIGNEEITVGLAKNIATFTAEEEESIYRSAMTAVDTNEEFTIFEQEEREEHEQPLTISIGDMEIVVGITENIVQFTKELQSLHNSTAIGESTKKSLIHMSSIDRFSTRSC